MHKHNCELDKLKKTMVDKRTFKKPLNTRGKLELICPRGRNARLEVFSSGNTE